MKAIARVLLPCLLLAAAIHAVGAQDLDLSGHNRFASFDLSLAPTLTGSLDGRADASLNWLDWLETDIELSALNSQQSTSGASGDSTRLTTTLSGSIEAIRINQELLWKLLPFKLRWLNLHAGILARGVNINEKYYGMDAAGTSFFDVHSTTNYVKPLAEVGGGFDFGLFKLDGTYEVSPFAVNESVMGSSVESSGSSPVTKDFSGQDIGLETRIDGKLSLDLRAFSLYAKGEYFRHLGYNQYVVGGIANPYAYSTTDYLAGGGIQLNFIKISGVSPYFGATWIQNQFDPISSASGGQVATSSSHWRIDFGFGI